MEWLALTPYHRAGWMDGGCGSMMLGTGSCSLIKTLANGQLHLQMPCIMLYMECKVALLIQSLVKTGLATRVTGALATMLSVCTEHFVLLCCYHIKCVIVVNNFQCVLEKLFIL